MKYTKVYILKSAYLVPMTCQIRNIHVTVGGDDVLPLQGRSLAHAPNFRSSTSALQASFELPQTFNNQSTSSLLTHSVLIDETSQHGYSTCACQIGIVIPVIATHRPHISSNTEESSLYAAEQSSHRMS
jgi:hypothetical protein